MADLEHPPSSLPAVPEWSYAPAPEARDIVSLQERYGLFVGGEWSSRARAHGSRPALRRDEQPLAEVAQAGAEDVDWRCRRPAPPTRAAGLTCGRPSGPSTCSGSRASCRNARASSRWLESLDGGKPIKESRDVDLPLAAAHFFYHAGWADKLEYAFPNRRPRPLGVAGQIIPWNFPLLMLAWKLAPALACGNTVVLKPAETTPLTALMFCDVCRQAELPPGS